ncbi:MAG: hypothetical protein LH479_13350, partial [Polaromonas sp.]|nr:hypothetical protein [Polaromonas sp.]
VIKRQFGFVKVRYRGLKKNTAQLFTLFALSNLWELAIRELDERLLAIETALTQVPVRLAASAPAG